jgi:hypothetical protein
VFINPMAAVGIEADELVITGNTLVFKRDNREVAHFNTYLGWIEVETKQESGTVLSLVGRRPVESPPGGDAS